MAEASNGVAPCKLFHMAGAVSLIQLYQLGNCYLLPVPISFECRIISSRHCGKYLLRMAACLINRKNSIPPKRHEAPRSASAATTGSVTNNERLGAALFNPKTKPQIGRAHV